MHPETDADPFWVADLTGRSVPIALRAVEEAGRERRLYSHLAREHEREGRRSYVEIDAPWELHAVTRLLRPEHVVEVGVSSGVSSAYLLRALRTNGRGTLHSIDLPSRPSRASRTPRPGGASWSIPADRTSGWAVPPGLRRGWDLRLGDKAALLPQFARELPRVPHDDADAWREFRCIDPLLSPGAVAIVDHGPRGELCSALRRWARVRGTAAVRRRGLGLFGMRNPRATGALGRALTGTVVRR